MTLALASAFGLVWQADVGLDHFAPCTDDTRRVDVSLSRVDALAARAALTTINRGFVYRDGIRFIWDDVVTFDMYDGCRVDYLPGLGWQGALPPCFFSTVAALILAWRGAVPIHGSTVMIDNRAIMICGASGAGKSTFAAALVTQGARLVADDLSVITHSPSGGFLVQPGRPTLRLHPETAHWITGAVISPTDDTSGKVLVQPPAGPRQAAELAGLVLLSGDGAPIPDILNFATMRSHVFRPRWLAELPGAQTRHQMLLAMARSLWLATHQNITVRSKADFDAAGRVGTQWIAARNSVVKIM